MKKSLTYMMSNSGVTSPVNFNLKEVCKRCSRFLFLIVFFLSGIKSKAQTLIFSENMGIPTGTTEIISNAFQNTSPISFSGNTDVRITSASSNYINASGGGNIFFGTANSINAREFLISGINTLNYTNLSLSFGVFTNTANSMLLVEYSSDGLNYTPLSVNSNINANTWSLKIANGNIPAVSNLRLRFSKNSGVSFRLDDVRISGTPTPILQSVVLSDSFVSTYGSASTGKLFSANGTNINGTITVTPSMGFEISITGPNNGYGDTALSVAPGINNVWIRTSAIKPVGIFNNTTCAFLSLNGAGSPVNVTTSMNGNQIQPKELLVTANDLVVSYGTPPIDIPSMGQYVLNGLVNNETDTVIFGGISFISNYNALSPAGTPGITITPFLSGSLSTNYYLTAISGTVSIEKANQVIAPIDAVISKTLADTTYSVFSTASSGLPVYYSSSDTSVASVDSFGTVFIHAPGNVQITLIQPGNMNFLPATSIHQTLTVSQIPCPTFSWTVTTINPICNGSNGSISFSATGGTGTIAYTVNGNSTTSPYTASAGTYTVEATDANACSTQTVVSVNTTQAPTATLTGTNTICLGTSTNLTLNFTGNAPWTYALNNGPQQTTSTNPIVIPVSPNATSTYTLTYFSDANCTQMVNADVTITVQSCGNPPPACGIPVLQTPQFVSGNQVNIAWLGNSDSVYFVWVRPVGSLFWGPRYTASATNYFLTNLTPNSGYEYQVRSVCKNGILSAAVIGQFTTTSGCTNSLSLNNPIAINGNSANLSWSGATDSVFQIAIKLSGASNWASFFSTNLNQRLITGLTLNTAYEYAVRSVCPGGDFSPWVVGQFTTTSGCGLPILSMPAIVQGNAAMLNWTGNSDSIYHVSFKLANAANWTGMYVVQGNSFWLNNLQANKQYHYRVRSVCANKDESTWVIGNFTTTIGCGTVTLNTPWSVTHQSAILSWNGNTDSVYNFYIRPLGSLLWGARFTVNGTQRAVTNLLPNTTYEYVVMSVCKNGDRSPGAFGQFTTNSAKQTNDGMQAQLFKFNARLNASREAEISWISFNEDQTLEYILEHAASSNTFTSLAQVPVQGSSSIDPLSGNTYKVIHEKPAVGINRYRVWMVNVDGTKTVHDEWITLNNDFGISALRCFPNPTDNELHITFVANEMSDVVFVVHDMQGRIMQTVNAPSSIGNNQTTMYLSDLPNGIYTLSIYQNQMKVSTERIKVMH